MQNRGKLPFSWQFTLFVVSSLIAVGICSSLALKSRKPLTIAQKGFLHDKERMISSVLINEKMTDRTLTNAVGRLLIKFLLLLSLYNLLFQKTFFIPYIRLYFLNTSNLISSIFFESFSSRLWSFSSLRACFIKASSHSRPCL